MFRKILSLLLVSFLLISSLFAGGNRWTSKPPVGSQIDWSHPLAKGLVSCWLFNEGGGLIVNDIARKNNGTISGALWKPAKRGVGLDFDGANDRINVGKNPSLGLSKWTFACRGYFTGVNDYDGIYTISGDYNRRVLLDRNGPRLLSQFSNINYYSATVTLSNWNSIVHTVDSINDIEQFYVNSVASTANSGNVVLGYTGNSTATIFGEWNTSYHMEGKFDGIVIWNRVLSPSEIQQLYQDPYCFIQPPTIWSKFSTAVAAARRFFIID